jgi:hypothetical protein
VKLTRPDKRKHWFRPLNFEADNVKSMVSSLQSCGTQCLAKKTVSALHRTQSRQDVLLHRMKEKPEAVSQEL